MTEDPRHHSPTSTGGSPWVKFGVKALINLFLVGAALVLTMVAFNFAIMPALVRQGKQIEVPNVVDRSLDEGVALLAEAGLAVRDTVERVHPTAAKGVVIDQEPPAGRAVKPERRVRLVLSAGGRERSVPDLGGQTLRFSRSALTQEGYVMGSVVKIPNQTVAKDFVMATDPPAGSALPPGTKVNVLVSSGPQDETWILPNFRGQPMSRLEQELRYAGFDVKTSVEQRERFAWRVEVIDTVPPPGSRVKRGDPILLIGS